MPTLSRLPEYINRARKMPPSVLIPKVLGLVNRTVKEQGERLGARLRTTYSPLQRTVTGAHFARLLAAPAPELVRDAFPELPRLLNHYLRHEFDLLGSGWVRVEHGLSAKGVGGHRFAETPKPTFDPHGQWLGGRINGANLKNSRSIWRMIQPGYHPIDWHIDFKSGYRWREDQFFTDIPYGHLLGVDIKVPWEISRAQHLTHLAYGFGLAQAGLLQEFSAARLALEYRHQVLDFIATNPPKFGVNWKCPMDVAIRAANWLVALDLFHAYGHAFDPEFYQVLHASLLDHGVFVLTHLERANDFRSNHYLADVAGVATIACYLAEGSPPLVEWLKFGHQELIKECEYQFFPEGTNFEGSTAYHRLSAEMVVYPTLLYLALPDALRRQLGAEPLFPDWYWERVQGMGQFARDIMKPNFQIVQFGDNDSGRFLKLHPCFRTSAFLEEDFLDFRHLVMAIAGLLDAEAPYAAPHGGLDYFVTHESAKLGAHQLATKPPAAAAALESRDVTSLTANWPKLFSQEYVFELPGLEPESVRAHFYPEMGYFIWRSGNDFFLALRCGPTGQKGRGGHDHNDQLAIELHWRGEDLVIDPGTYLYTALPAERNWFRSRLQHWAPRPENYHVERFEHGLFSMPSDHQFIGFKSGGDFGFYCNVNRNPFIRLITFASGSLKVRDYSDASLARLSMNQQPRHSSAYGRLD